MFTRRNITIAVVLLFTILVVLWVINREPEEAPVPVVNQRQEAIDLSKSFANENVEGPRTPYFCMGVPNACFSYTMKSVSGGCPVRPNYCPGQYNRFSFNADQVSAMSIDLSGDPRERIAIAVTMVIGKSLVTESRYLTLDKNGYRRTKITVDPFRREVAIL